MVAHDPFTGKTTEPTKVEIDRDGDSKVVRYPNDPHIAASRHRAEERPQTVLTGFAQGGTTNPPAGDDGEPKWFAPAKDGHSKGEEEESSQPMFQRDREVNPKPHEALEGQTIGAVDASSFGADENETETTVYDPQTEREQAQSTSSRRKKGS